MASNQAPKRKAPAATFSKPNGHAHKLAKRHDARALAVQSADAALSATGELDVAAYVGAREYEIRALEAGMERSKGVLMSRAFQKVPRSLRRRTASHNVKRVPKRLRARARREMLEDNTPTVTARRRKPTRVLRIRLETFRRLQNLNKKAKSKRAVAKLKRDQEKKSENEASNEKHGYNIAPRIPKIKKNKLSQPLPPDSKYKKRQRGKTWLPTHLFHAKRAHMTPPKEPLWRFAVPMTPTEKSYRPTHRAAGSRGAVAWDMSYMSTIQLEGVRSALEAVLKSLHIEGDDCWGPKGKKWRQGTRTLSKWIHETGENAEPIAPVTLIWCPVSDTGDTQMTNAETTASRSKKQRQQDKVLIRVHPSAFLQLWEALLATSKRQNPPVAVQDLRFDIGSIEITGPGSTEALIATMRPFHGPDSKDSVDPSPETTWSSLLGVTNSSSLPAGALLAFNISDPRLHYPLKPQKLPTSESGMNELANLLSNWPPDHCRTPYALFDRSARLSASRCLPSQKAINRRRALAGPGEPLKPQTSDPCIPVIAFGSRPENVSKEANSTGSWTILLPWKCVTPLWYMLMFYPLSSGGNTRFGGLKEQRQLAFEYGRPWFPGDYPGTRAGREWDLQESQTRKKEWERKPKGRRVEFDGLDLGNGQTGELGQGWACDWERLVQGKPQQEKAEDTQETKDVETVEAEPPHCADPIQYLRIEPRVVFSLNSQAKPWRFPDNKPFVTTVKITLIGRGTPTTCARVYRLPSNNEELRNQWLLVASSARKNIASTSPGAQSLVSSSKKQNQNPTKDPLATKNESLQKLASSLLETPSSLEQQTHLPLPCEEDLIGFVTSGNYNLSEGKGTGIGSILVSKVSGGALSQSSKKLNQKDTKKACRERRLCIVRSAGERVGRLGEWEFV
ncbi:ribonuclease P [Talaromyces islandicus]|uniref:Ribonuclease P n=1 Tax=Talaromyces islandicus TaxID=28573 RepID=A0A0U1LS39_TALIS|nr:ribonuclease P [Talaromyces islandicus]